MSTKFPLTIFFLDIIDPNPQVRQPTHSAELVGLFNPKSRRPAVGEVYLQYSSEFRYYALNFKTFSCEQPFIVIFIITATDRDTIIDEKQRAPERWATSKNKDNL